MFDPIETIKILQKIQTILAARFYSSRSLSATIVRTNRLSQTLPGIRCALGKLENNEISDAGGSVPKNKRSWERQGQPTKFRAGSHQLKIETGRWSRTARGDRLCTHCNVLGDEHHAVYDCDLIHRGDLADTPTTLSSLWDYSKVNVLFERMRVAGLVE